MRALFDAALAAADPAQAIAPHIPAPVRGRTVVVGAGKASAAMARAFETAWSGPLQGVVVTRHGHAVPCERITIVEASHPVPDRAGEEAARDILDLARELLERIWPVLDAGRCGPVIHQVFPLAQAAEAHRLMESGTHIGKIMLKVI